MSVGLVVGLVVLAMLLGAAVALIVVRSSLRRAEDWRREGQRW